MLLDLIQQPTIADVKELCRAPAIPSGLFKRPADGADLSLGAETAQHKLGWGWWRAWRNRTRYLDGLTTRLGVLAIWIEFVHRVLVDTGRLFPRPRIGTSHLVERVGNMSAQLTGDFHEVRLVQNRSQCRFPPFSWKISGE